MDLTRPIWARLIVALALPLALPVTAYDLDPNSTRMLANSSASLMPSIQVTDPDLYDALESVKTIAKQMADDMLSFYDGDKPGFVPGLLPEPYYCKAA
jgi:hypothetical protein